MWRQRLDRNEDALKKTTEALDHLHERPSMRHKAQLRPNASPASFETTRLNYSVAVGAWILAMETMSTLENLTRTITSPQGTQDRVGSRMCIGWEGAM